MAARKKLLLVQENFQPPGGGQGVSAWAIQALAADYDLDLLTWVPLQVEPINTFYGTTLRPDQFRVIELPAALRAAVNLDTDPYSFQPIALISRYAKRIQHRYDLLIGLSNEADFGAPAIQYIHYPYLELKYLAVQKARGSLSATLRQQYSFYLRPWRVISGFNFERMKRNVTLVNSDWTGARVQNIYNIPTRTLYPPVAGGARQVAWAERVANFIALGRLSACKRYDLIIEILRRVRARGCPVHLHLVASLPYGHVEMEAVAALRSLVAEHSEWVHWHANLPRRELDHLISMQRYALHAMVGEHFGMAIAEMMRGGCIPFVHNSGGQVEIVAGEPRLVYENVEDAVEKICRVLASPADQHELHQVLAARAERYSETAFMRQLADIVAARV